MRLPLTLSIKDELTQLGLFKIWRTIKPGAHRLFCLLSEQERIKLSILPTILIGGSNGKGTTCHFLESFLRHAGLKTGLYTSPHLIDPCERVKIEGVPVFSENFFNACKTKQTLAQTCLPDASFFEIMTSASFSLFLEEDIDVLVCEVGLGGRLDSTNILSPMVSVLTSISLEHTELLGKEEKEIAKEKSYIGRKSRPFVLGPLTQDLWEKGVKPTLEKIGSYPIFSETFCFEDPIFKEAYAKALNHSSWLTANQQNLKTALTAFFVFQKEWNKECHQKTLFFSKKHPITINQSSLLAAITRTFIPGRYDKRRIENKTLLLDVCHNKGGLLHLLPCLKKEEKKWTVLFGSLSDKEWDPEFPLLKPYIHSFILSGFSSERAFNEIEFGEKVSLHYPTKIFSSLKESLQFLSLLPKSNSSSTPLSEQKAVDDVVTENILIFGSIAFVGAVMEELRLSTAYADLVTDPSQNCSI